MSSLPEFKARYQIQKEIGKGGFGVTHLALDTHTSQLCAIKELSFQRVEDWKSLELFEREAKVLSNLKHPQIPHFIDFITEESESEQKLYLIQEYIEGQSLKELVESGKHFTQEEILDVTIQATKILAYLQSLSPPIIHRDIKPGNMIINPDGEVFLIDFGAVRDTVANRIGGGSTVVGTFGYMPPEQFDGKALSGTDIFSLGTTMIYALSRKEPHQIEKKALKLNFRPLVNISANFAQILDQMIEPDHTERYQNASDLLIDLIKLKSGVYKNQREDKFKELNEKPIWKKIGLSLTAVLILAWIGMIYLNVQQDAEMKKLMIDGDKILQKYKENPFKLNEKQFKKPEKLMSPSPPPKSEAITEFTSSHINPNEAVKVKLYYRGLPIKNFTTVEPHFWFRNETTNKVQKSRTQLWNDHYLIGDLPLGKFGMQIYINANSDNPNMYPGDYRAWKSFQVTDIGYPLLHIDLLKVIHLLKPQDNEEKMAGWGKVCDGENDLNNDVQFEWESLGGEVEYTYTITTYQCPFKFVKNIKSEKTNNTSFELDLPPNAPEQFYLLRLTAKSKNKHIGSLITHGNNGMGWDYRFRIIE